MRQSKVGTKHSGLLMRRYIQREIFFVSGRIFESQYFPSGRCFLSLAKTFPPHAYQLALITLAAFSTSAPSGIFRGVLVSMRAVCFFFVAKSCAVCMCLLRRDFKMEWVYTRFVFTQVMKKLVWGKSYIINQLVAGSVSTPHFAFDDKRPIPARGAPACPYPTPVFGYEAA